MVVHIELAAQLFIDESLELLDIMDVKCFGNLLQPHPFYKHRLNLFHKP